MSASLNDAANTPAPATTGTVTTTRKRAGRAKRKSATKAKGAARTTRAAAPAPPATPPLTRSGGAKVSRLTPKQIEQRRNAARSRGTRQAAARAPTVPEVANPVMAALMLGAPKQGDKWPTDQLLTWLEAVVAGARFACGVTAQITVTAAPSKPGH